MDAIDPNKVFGDDRTTQADFEIAFTAVVITIVLAVPSNTAGYQLLKSLVILLSIITLVRRMAVSNNHRDSDPVLKWTMPLILTITTVAFTHLFLEGAVFLISTFKVPVSPISVAAFFIPVFVAVVFVFHEIVLHDANLYLALLCQQGAARASEFPLFGADEWLPDWFLNKGSGFAQASNAEVIPPALSWLEHRVETDVSPNALPFAVVGLIGYGAIWAIVSLVFGSRGLTLLFLVFVFALIYPVQFWFSRFGLARFTPERTGWINPLVSLLGLIVAHWTILPEYT